MTKTIAEIKYSDGTSEIFEKKAEEKFQHFSSYSSQLTDWEEDKIFPYLKTDLERYSKENYNLTDESDQKDLDDFDDGEIEYECIRRKIAVSYATIQNSNIMNQKFIDRLIEIINRGSDGEIDLHLEILEKKYHIK